MALFTRTVARSTSALSMTTRNFVGITATEGVLPTQVFLDGHLTAYTQSAPKREAIISRPLSSFVGVNYLTEADLPTSKTSSCSSLELTTYTSCTPEMATPELKLKDSKLNVTVNVDQNEIPLPLLRSLKHNGALHY